MIRADQIPDEVVEAAARAEYETMRAEAISDHGAIAETMYCPWEKVSPDAKEYYMRLARAAIAAAINAWPGATMYGPHPSGHGPTVPQLILPLPQKGGDA